MNKMRKLFSIVPYLIFFVFPAQIKRKRGAADVIVSVTSYSSRMKWLPITLSSVLREPRVKRILLFIAEGEKIPWNLKGFIKKNQQLVSLIPTSNSRSYKKLYPVIDPEQIASPADRSIVIECLKDHDIKGIITVDDDIIYKPGSLLALLCDPKSIVCSIARKKTANLKYRHWSTLKPGRYTSKIALAIGAGGIFYPKEFIYSSRGLDFHTEFELYCPNQDDLWWNILQIHGDYTITVVQTNIIKLDNIFRMQKLSAVNVQDGNDMSIDRLRAKWKEFI